MQVTPTDGLATPVYAKTDEDFVWPKDPFFYLVTKDGLFLCRNTKFARSCVKAATYPPDFGGQESFLFSKYPKIGAKDIAQVEGWFRDVANKHGCEAAALLVYDEVTEKVLIKIPKQTGGLDGAGRYVLDVKFDIIDVVNALPNTQRLIGSIHSHVFHSAYSSWTDQNDEVHWAGVHIVYGCLDKKNPEIHTEIVQDGNRFSAKTPLVMEDYEAPLHDYPKEWWDQLKCEIIPSRTVRYTNTDDASYGSGSGYGSNNKNQWGGYQKWQDEKSKKPTFEKHGFYSPEIGSSVEDTETDLFDNTFEVDDAMEDSTKAFDQDAVDRQEIEGIVEPIEDVTLTGKAKKKEKKE